MTKRTINPWTWQEKFGYAQAVEVTQAANTLYVAGQTATAADGSPSTADMKTQLRESIAHLETVLAQADYACSNIVRLVVYTTSQDELLPHFDVLTDWMKDRGVQPAMTVVEVKALFATLTVELEVTAVR